MFVDEQESPQTLFTWKRIGPNQAIVRKGPPEQSSKAADGPGKKTKIRNRIIRILRDIKIETVDDAVTELLTDGNIYTFERASTVINIVIDHAIRFTRSTSIYVKFLKQVMDRKPAYGGEDFDFKELLYEEYATLNAEISAGEVKNTRQYLLGIARLFGVLYLHGLCHAEAINSIVYSLILHDDRELDYVCELLAIVGKRIETHNGQEDFEDEWYRDMSEHYEQLHSKASKGDNTMNAETRARIINLIQYRKDGWKDEPVLIFGDYGPLV